VEKILNLILTKVEGLETGQARLEAGQDKLAEQIVGLNAGQDKLAEQIVGLNAGQDKLAAGQSELRRSQISFGEHLKKMGERLGSVEHKLDVVYRQTGELTEFRTETVMKLDKLIEGQEKMNNDIEFLAGELGKQKLDIDRLKKRPV